MTNTNTEETNGELATHYCDDCDGELIILYDERPDKSVPIVCGGCGGTNTRKLDEPVPVESLWNQNDTYDDATEREGDV